ncbi:MAG: protein translocase subunit SecF [Bryobacteraceae bacterium]|nr:protein translocase subunit SecF [Bryobacteraceae bacterium]
MELFKNPRFDFLGRKWPFIIVSLVLTVAGLASLAVKGGPRYGIDFKGGTLMYLKFAKLPPLDQIRSALSERIQGEVSVQEVVGDQEVMVSTELQSEAELEAARRNIIETLNARFGGGSDKPDLNNAGQQLIAERLRDPLQRKGVVLSEDQLEALAGRIRDFRDTPPRSGLLRSVEELSKVEGVTPAALATIGEEFHLSPFSIRSIEVVGPKIGAEIRRQAMMATLLALGGMLVYIAFRFELMYGVAAVIAVFHDVIITVGLFSITDREISLTVVAALLTLVGYSMNDTIVTFDRIRENLKTMRRLPYPELVNLSINHTLNRTLMTSGLTFLTVLALYLFGGQVLSGFAFALVVGILIGTYSSIFIASPILVFWQGALERRKRAAGRGPAAAPARKNPVRGDSAKAVKQE